MLSSEHLKRTVVAEGIEIELPVVTAIPLGFIANELITNAVKYGAGRITVSLEANSEKGYALSVADSTDRLCRRALIQPIAKDWECESSGLLSNRSVAELQFSRDDSNRGARFTVLFS